MSRVAHQSLLHCCRNERKVDVSSLHSLPFFFAVNLASSLIVKVHFFCFSWLSACWAMRITEAWLRPKLELAEKPLRIQELHAAPAHARWHVPHLQPCRFSKTKTLIAGCVSTRLRASTDLTSNWPAAILDFATWIDAVCGVAKKLRSKLVRTELVPPQIKFGSPLFNLFRPKCARTVQKINAYAQHPEFWDHQGKCISAKFGGQHDLRIIQWASCASTEGETSMRLNKVHKIVLNFTYFYIHFDSFLCLIFFSKNTS